jgi:hypothetical protein
LEDSRDRGELRLAAAFVLADRLSAEELEPAFDPITKLLVETESYDARIAGEVVSALPGGVALDILEALARGTERKQLTAAALNRYANPLQNKGLAAAPDLADRWANLDRLIQQNSDEIRKKLITNTPESRSSILEELVPNRQGLGAILSILKYAQDEDTRVRHGVVDTLVQFHSRDDAAQILNSSRSKESLFSKLDVVQDPAIRQEIFKLLARCSWQGEADLPWRERLRNFIFGTDPHDARIAAETLAAWGTDPPPQRAEEISYVDSTQHQEWYLALQAMRQTPHLEARAVIEQLISQKDWSPFHKEVLSMAVGIIQTAHRNGKAPDLSEPLQLLDKDSLKRVAISKILSVDDPFETRDPDKLGRLLSQTWGPTRVLQELGPVNELAIPELAKLLQDEVRPGLFGVIAALHLCGPEAKSALETLPNHPDPQVRVLAEEAISRPLQK